MQVIKLSIQGIDINIQFGEIAKREYGKLCIAMMNDKENTFLELAALNGIPMLLYCGYYDYCKSNDHHLLFEYEDFQRFTDEQAATSEGMKLIESIAMQYADSI